MQGVRSIGGEQGEMVVWSQAAMAAFERFTWR
jgi:hypothetical protein